jgi:hypothetical protein
MGTVQVRKMRLHSTSLKTHLASLIGGPLVVVGPPAVAGLASSRGHHRVLVKSIGRTSPRYIHRIYTRDSNLCTYKNDI